MMEDEGGSWASPTAEQTAEKFLARHYGGLCEEFDLPGALAAVPPGLDLREYTRNLALFWVEYFFEEDEEEQLPPVFDGYILQAYLNDSTGPDPVPAVTVVLELVDDVTDIAYGFYQEMLDYLVDGGEAASQFWTANEQLLVEFISAACESFFGDLYACGLDEDIIENFYEDDEGGD